MQQCYPNDFWPSEQDKNTFAIVGIGLVILSFLLKFAPVENGGGGAKTTSEAIQELNNALSSLQRELDVRTEEIRVYLSSDLLTGMSAKVYGIARAIDFYRASGDVSVLAGTVAIVEEATKSLEMIMADRPGYLGDESHLILEDLFVASLAQRALVYSYLEFKGLTGDETSRLTSLLVSIFREGNASALAVEKKKYKICEVKLDPVWNGPDGPSPKISREDHWFYSTFVGYRTLNQRGCGPGKTVGSVSVRDLGRKVRAQRRRVEDEINRISEESISITRKDEIDFINEWSARLEQD